MKEKETINIGIDIGGTFTDIVITSNIAKPRLIKLLNSDPITRNIEKVILEVGDKSGLENIANIYHATTAFTNAILTRKGLGRVALITTEGFRDIIEIGRQNRTDLYDLYQSRPEPLVAKNDRFVLRERLDYTGKEIVPIDINQLNEIVKVINESNFDSVAICFLHSYKNPQHEIQVRSHLLKEGYKGWISISSEVDPEHREYERFSTTVVDAAIKPVVLKYIDGIAHSLNELGYKGNIYWITSDGQMNTADYAKTKSISVIESGPSAGVIAAASLANIIKVNNVITLDMGGTTAKASTITDGNIELASEIEVGGKTASGRQIKGSGYTVRYPHIDLAEVSAGGGSIAAVSEDGLLTVGPASAGAKPGPAGYGLGGTEPTVTDATIVLGYISQDSLLGGQMPIYYKLAEKAIKNKVADKLGVDTISAAASIIKLATLHMSRAITLVTMERGKDPKDYTMMAFGGGGPVFAAFLCEELGIDKFLVPAYPGIFSAIGLLSVRFGRTYVRSVLSKRESDAEYAFMELERIAKDEFKAQGINQIQFLRFAQVRYTEQSHELTVDAGVGSIFDEFEKRHEKAYGYRTKGDKIITNVILQAFKPESINPNLFDIHDSGLKKKYKRNVFFEDDFVETPVYSDDSMDFDKEYLGPMVVELYDSTIVVPPKWKVAKRKKYYEVTKYD